MKKLFRVSFDILVTSLIPILSWFFLSIILDKKLINVFSLTYPMQCVTGMIVALFGVGANICVYKDNNKDAPNSGLFYGLLISVIIFSLLIFNCEKYISFMNMNIFFYKIPCQYSMFQIFCQTIVQLIITKLYYEEKNEISNKIVVSFNFINFVILVGVAIISHNQIVTVLISGFIMSLCTIFLSVYYFRLGKNNLNLKNCFKYNSPSFCISFLFFLMYLFGFSNSFQFGEKYTLAISFVVLITDMQWDITEAVKSVSKIDIVKKNFIYKDHFKNASKLYFLLIISVLVLGFIFYPLYKPDLFVVSIFVICHIIDFILALFIDIKVVFLNLEYSSLKMTINTIIAYIIRTFISFFSTPFCTIIGQLSSSIYLLVCTSISFRIYKFVLKNRL